MIELSEMDKRWIRLTKGHYKDKYGDQEGWIATLIPMYKEYYFINPDEYMHDFLGCMFNILLDIYLLISDDKSGCSQQLKEVFDAAFYKNKFERYEDTPIERAIGELCSQIRYTSILNNDKTKRFSLSIEGEPDWKPKKLDLSKENLSS